MIFLLYCGPDAEVHKRGRKKIKPRHLNYWPRNLSAIHAQSHFVFINTCTCLLYKLGTFVFFS